MWYTQKATQQLISKLFDCYGDSYTEETTIESLMEIFKKINSEIDMTDTDQDSAKDAIAKIENKYFSNHSSRFGLFRLINAYLDVYEVVQDENKPLKNSDLELFGIKLAWRGGFIHKKIDDSTTHCILDER